MKKWIAIAIFLLVAVATWQLPKFRDQAWRKTKRSTIVATPAIEGLTEQELAQAAIEEKNDESTLDHQRNLRKIRSVPSSNVGLEAAFRQRSPDSAEFLEVGEPLHLSQFVRELTPRDKNASLGLSTRRQILTVGLEMLESDRRLLPTLSKPLILSFLNAHYVTIQVRILKDPDSGKWLLHHRPMAAIGKLSGLPLSQEWVEAISTTVRDIRGLGIYEAEAPQDDTQTVVWLFRSAWMEGESRNPKQRYELGIVHAIPNESDEDPLEFHLFTTSNERTLWHYLPRVVSRVPKSLTNCDLVSSVRFIEFTPDGLQPKVAVTRKLKVNASTTYSVVDLDRYLRTQGMEGGWHHHLKEAIDGIIRGKVNP